MPVGAGSNMKAWLRVDLRATIKEGRTAEARVIRALLAAIDNAEAPPAQTGQTALVQHLFNSGSAEVERLLLSESQVRDVLLAEIHERECAAAEYDCLQMTDRAEVLRAEALLAKRYIE